jgi:iron complex outermembrane recepter protein
MIRARASKYTRKLVAICAPALLLVVCRFACAQAQSADIDSTASTLKQMSLEELLDVEVTSVARHPEKLSHTPSAIQVISAEDIRRSGATSLAEALRLASNLDVAQKNSHDWAISARGFNTALANKLLVLIDGRTVYTPLFSGVYWDLQNTLLADVDRIEVISGPGGTQWGSNAVNGVINIITKNARDTQGTYLETAAGDQLKNASGARYGGAFAPDVYFRVYGQYADRGDEMLADSNSALDDWHQTRAGFRLDAMKSAADSFTVQGDTYRGDEDIVTGGVSDVSGGNVLGRWTHTAPDGTESILQTYYDHTHLTQPVGALVVGSLQLAPAGTLVDDLDTFDVDFQQRFVVGERNRIEWGLGYRFTNDQTMNAPALAFLPPHLDQSLYSAFVQDEFTLRDDLVLSAGTKLEHNDYTGFEAEPSARLQWNVRDDQLLWAAISRAVRTPSRVDRDLSEPAPAASPLIILEGSADFTAESLIAYELGYRGQLGANIAASLSAFYNDYDHIRSTSITPATVVPFFFANNLEGETHGIELTLDARVTDSWRLRASYDPLIEHLHVKPGTTDLNDALNETADPHTRFAIRSSLDLPRHMEWDTALRWTDARAINSGPTVAFVPSYWELEMRLGWHVNDNLELSLVGQNLLHDHHLEYGFPGPAQVEIVRSVFGKVAWHF